MRPLDLGAPRLFPLIFAMALPSVAGLSINAAYQLADAAFVAWLSAESVAAVSLALPLFILVAALGHGIGVAASTEIGRALGRGDSKAADRTAGLALALALAAGLACAIVVGIWHRPLLQALGAEGTVLEQAAAYSRIVGLGATLVLLQIVCDFIALGEGNSRFSMMTLIGGFGLNIVLDPIFIFALGLGVAGAAIATLISQGAVLAVYWIYFTRGASGLSPRPRRAQLMRTLRPFADLGLPATATTGLAALSLAVLMHSGAALGGDEDLAALGLSLRIATLAILPVVGFCLGAQPLLGFAFGRGDTDRLDGAFLRIAGVCVVFTGSTALFLALGGETLLKLFALGEAAERRGARLLAILALQVAAAGIYLPVLVLLQASDRPRSAALVSLAPQGYLLLPLALLLPGALGFSGIAWASAAAALATALIAVPLAARRPAPVPLPEPPR